MEQQEIRTHLLEHIQYPATKQDLVQQCNMMSDIPESDRNWFQNNLPDATYNSADEVMRKLNL